MNVEQIEIVHVGTCCKCGKEANHKKALGRFVEMATFCPECSPDCGGDEEVTVCYACYRLNCSCPRCGSELATD